MTKKSAPIIDLHLAVQGEGTLMGRSSILIRTSGCNLTCVFANSICDTPYSSHSPEKGKYSLEEVETFVKSHPQIKSLIITGGEPCLHPNHLELIFDMFPDHHITIETNSSIQLEYDLMHRVDLVSMSPKLSTSTMTKEKAEKLGILYSDLTAQMHERKRLNLDSIMSWILNAKDYHLKYVVTKEEDISELLEQLKDLEDRGITIPTWKIFLMPAGVTDEQLQVNRQWLMEKCLELGFSYSDRLQIIAYGNRRDV